MLRPKVFIGSSGKSYPLVEWLAEKLRLHEIAHPFEWKFDSFEVGMNTLDNLLENCRKCDLAVIFLTADDATQKPSLSPGGATIMYAPRDNCIFEAGLFTGALGLDPTRCLLVSSVEQSALPSDLLGLTLVPMPRPLASDDFSDEWCDENLQSVFAKVQHQIKAKQFFFQRPVLDVFTKDQLAEHERVGGARGDLRRGESVVVNTFEPVERDDLRFATQVLENIENRIKYRYFFQQSEGSERRSIELLRMLVLAGVTKAQPQEQAQRELLRSNETCKTLLNHERESKAVIEQLRQFIRIGLLEARAHLPLRVCVHNAQSSETAKCYLYYTSQPCVHGVRPGVDYFVHWFSGPAAREVAAELYKLGAVASNEHTTGEVIFADIPRERTSQIEKEIRELFPAALCDDMIAACLNGPQTVGKSRALR